MRQDVDSKERRGSDIEPLKALANLQRLYLSRTQVAREQVAALRKALPKLEILC